MQDDCKLQAIYVLGMWCNCLWNWALDSWCIQLQFYNSQFKEEVEKGDTQFCLPYKMEKGKIEDTSTGTSYSIK